MEAFHTIWRQDQTALNWNCLFVTPVWLQTVMRHLGTRGDPLILGFFSSGRPIGVVPLSINGKRAQFLGRADVCDYQDIIAVPGQEAAVMRGLTDYLRQTDIHFLDLQTLRPDAALYKGIEPLAASGRVKFTRSRCDVTFETPLPASWDDYLMLLNGKQRHEVRRKMRRLDDDGPFKFRLSDPAKAPGSDIEAFLRLFQMNREDKADFMDGAMSAYFSDLMNSLAGHDILRLYFLELAAGPAAAVLCFDFGGVRYLYNNAYDARYNDLSVGILSKVFSIRAGIETGCRHYDFLKGAETYKKHIGGQQVQLHRCLIEW
jgi:CelD/BcsL family acetyltransferase involved in cellulose biosynthesis